MRHLPLIAALTLSAASGAALASTDEAWTEFRADVEAKCRALLAEGAEADIRVNPFGSEKFGAAIVTTTPKEGAAEISVCIYDKQAKSAEMTGPFEPEN